MVKGLSKLKVLNISGNTGLSSESIRKWLVSLKNATHITDLEFGKLNFGNNEDCYKEIAIILLQSRALKSLNLQRVSLDDSTAFYLIEGFVRATNLQTIKLDYNKLTGVFIERLCKKLMTTIYTPKNANKTLS